MITKYLSLVFVVYYDPTTNKDYVLMSRINDPEKKTKGMINGYGGKCEEGETTEVCAIREVGEELGLEIKKENLQKVGVIKNNEKSVDVFIVKSKDKFGFKKLNPKDLEMKNPTWYDFAEVHGLPLLPRNNEVMEGVWNYLILKREGKNPETFFVDKTNDVGTQLLKVGEGK